MRNESPIDFVVTWVDDRDPVWRAKKQAYTGTAPSEGNTDARYRDWDTLKYWFRGVEKFAPWVRYVYFVTDDQKPEWLNLDHPKLKWVKHTDYIPKEYLPTFNSNVIEWHFHRIPGLAEQFVYFNDDMFLIRDTKAEDFFVDGIPCDFPVLGIIYPEDSFSYIPFNNTALLNEHFSLKDSIRRNLAKWIRHQPLKNIVKTAYYGRHDQIPGLTSLHIHCSYKKSTFETLWKVAPERLHAACMDKLRTKRSMSHWCVRDWQILSGDFMPQKPLGAAFPSADMEGRRGAAAYVRKQKGKVVCVNDSETEMDFLRHKQMLIDAFETILPEKCGFER